MKRTLTIDTTKYLGKKVRIAGWVDSRRDHGGIVFLDLRDRTGIVQVVSAAKLAKDIKEEYVLDIEGRVQKRPAEMVNPDLKTGKIEIKADKVNVLAKCQALPFDIKGSETSLPVLLDFRPLTLRTKRNKAIFRVQEKIIDSFRNTMKGMGFSEFNAPTIVGGATEGGSDVFRLNYYGHDAYMAQSPQFYKQIMVGVFERVFCVTHAYRAEPSMTTRHLAEYISLDAEMGFIDSWEDIMDTCEAVIKGIFSSLDKDCKQELNLFGAVLPEFGSEVPRIKMEKAQDIIFKRTKRDIRGEPDLDPEGEREICSFAKEKYGSDFVFVTHYPTKKRPFYTFPDPKDPEYTLSFDLLCRGLEIVTGGQRINDYDQLVKNVKKWGNKVSDLQFYLQAFKYGMPPEGGFCLGGERMTKQILNLENVREASLFPRDMIRIDNRLSALKDKKDLKNDKDS